jgi:ferric-dicitrate binding protein FerR (iron transport regulator)
MTEQYPGELPDDELANLLTGALRTPQLPDEALARIRSQVESRWRDETARRPQRHYGWAGLLAASLSACAVLAWWTIGRSPVLGTVESGSLGAPALRVNQSVQARDNTSVRLSSGGVLRIKAGSSLVVTSRDEIALQDGTVYLDFDPAAAHGTLHVRTPLGVVQHLGTQFEVALLDHKLRVRVREGSVRVVGESPVQAGAGEELVLAADQTLQRRALAPYDSEWSWVASPPTSFDAEGKSALQLLDWVARETGRRIEFPNESAAQLARGTVLHGSIRGLSPDLALRAMLSTTSLAAEVRTDSIAVRVAP